MLLPTCQKHKKLKKKKKIQIMEEEGECINMLLTDLQQAWLVEDGSVERAVTLDRGVHVG